APDFFHFYARACNTEAIGRQKNYADTGGASADRSTALAKAVGEAVERYCVALYEAEELPLTSRERAPFRCVDPAAFALDAPRSSSATPSPSPGRPGCPARASGPSR